MSSYESRYFEGRTSGYKLGYALYDSRARWEPVANEILKFKAAGRILDIGCAYGFFLKFMPPSFRKCGVEISPEAAALARKNNPGASIFSGDFLSRKIGGKFDVITAFEVLEHMPNLAKTLAKIHSMLKDGGYLFASFPIVESFLERRWFTQFDETHVNPSDDVLAGVRKKFDIISKKFTFDCFSFIIISRFRISPVHQSYFVAARKR